MMRPMKLAGDELIFGKGCLSHLSTLKAKRAMIVTGGSSMKKSGILDRVDAILKSSGTLTAHFGGVEPDPSFNTVMEGAREMQSFGPDLIIALGGGSAMDAAKAMWVFYEHPEIQSLQRLMSGAFPKLRAKARLCCIPSTSGTASEVSRSVVITDKDIKHGLGHMEMMPDIAILDPEVTATMPPHVTAETGMDALTHALEALVSRRANFLSDLLVKQAIVDIAAYLPVAYLKGDDLDARETMLNASMIAGMAFTNVSLGIVHSMAHSVGSIFHISHGLADAVLLPYVIEYNSQEAHAKEKYRELARLIGENDMAETVRKLNEQLKIPRTLCELINDNIWFTASLPELTQLALNDGCTKTNPLIPTPEEMTALYEKAYKG